MIKINKFKEKINKINDNKITKNIIFFISMLIISWSFIISIKSILKTIIFATREQFYTLEQIDNLMYIIGNIQGSILMIPIFLGMIMLFRKKITLLLFAFCIFLSFNFNSYEFFDNTIHPFLFSLHVYDFLLLDGQKSINPQYTKLFFYIIITTALIVQSSIKKYRSLDKIFLTLILLVVIGTNTIFHIALPLGMLKMARHDGEIILLQNINKETLPQLCQKRNCFDVDNNLNLRNQLTNSEKVIYNSYSFLFGKYRYLIEKDQLSSYTTSVGNAKSKGFDYVIIGIKKQANGYLLIVDEESLKAISRHSEIWFSFLLVMVHLFWVYGAISLLFLHKTMAFRKLSPRFDKSVNEEK